MKRIFATITLGIVCWVAACDSGSTANQGALLAQQQLTPQSVRGFGIRLDISDAKLIEALDDYPANALRLQLMFQDLFPGSTSSIPTTTQISPTTLSRIRRIVELANAHGGAVILDIHEFPGLCRWSCSKANFEIWHPTKGVNERTLLVKAWEQLATEFRDKTDDQIVYEILNEPEPIFVGTTDQGDLISVDFLDQDFNVDLWSALLDEAIVAIRNISPTKIIIVSPPDSWRFNALIRWGVSTLIRSDPNIWVAAHFYHPHDFTHQLQSGAKKGYPGWFDGSDNENDNDSSDEEFWSLVAVKAFISSSLQGFRRHSASLPIVVTEFSCVKDAPGCVQWLKDTTDSFYEHDMGFIYHDFGVHDSNWELGGDREDAIRAAMQRK